MYRAASRMAVAASTMSGKLRGVGHVAATARRHGGTLMVLGTRPQQKRPLMSASLIGRLGSSAFRLSTNSSVDVAHGLALLFGLGTKGPSIMGIRRRGGTIFRATLPSM